MTTGPTWSTTPPEARAQVCSPRRRRRTSSPSASTPTSTRAPRPDQKPLILTSALKGVDTAVFNFIEDDANGKFKAGFTTFDLKANGVGYATSNPKIDAYKAKIEEFKQKIINGQITVPEKP